MKTILMEDGDIKVKIEQDGDQSPTILFCSNGWQWTGIERVSRIQLALLKEAIAEAEAQEMWKKQLLTQLSWKEAGALAVEKDDYIKVLKQLNNSLEHLLSCIPECPVHGACIPHAIEWVKVAREKLGPTV